MTTAFRTTPIEIKLSEGQAVPTKVQLMRTCTFYHQKYGKVEVTPKLLSELVENFKKKVRRIDPAIDYAHNSEEEAAGWITGLEIVDNTELGEKELWATVDWTPSGSLCLSEKKFRYLSADFHPNYSDNETPDIKHGAVLLGAGLTNRPVIKGMKPVVLSEEPNKESYMTEEEIKAAEDKLAKIANLMTDLGVNSVEELMAKITEMQSQNKELTEEKVLSEKKAKTEKLFSEGKISKAQADEAIKLSGESFDSFIRLAEMNTPIKGSDLGHAGKGSDEDETLSAQDKVIALAEAKSEKEKIDIGQAISIVLSENKELAKEYRKETSFGSDEE